MIRVMLPAHLRALIGLKGEVDLEVAGSATQRSVVDALETRYPMLRGTIRDHVTQERRPFVRFFACEQDLSHVAPDAPLPDAVVTGADPLMIVGAIAGG
jgi:molybdopterin converting factor small subunit